MVGDACCDPWLWPLEPAGTAKIKVPAKQGHPAPGVERHVLRQGAGLFGQRHRPTLSSARPPER